MDFGCEQVKFDVFVRKKSEKAHTENARYIRFLLCKMEKEEDDETIYVRFGKLCLNSL